MSLQTNQIDNGSEEMSREQLLAELKRLRREKVSSEERYRTLVENPSLGIILMDRRGRYLYVSPKIEEVTGYTPAEFYAEWRLGWRITHPKDHKLGERAFGKARIGRPVQHVEIRLVRKDGEERWASASCFPVRDADGAVTSVQIILQDVTDRKRAEDGLREKSKALAETNTLLGERTRLLESSHHMGSSVLSSLDLDTILDSLTEQIVNAGIFRSLTVALVDDENHSIEMVRSWQYDCQRGHFAAPINYSYDLDSPDIFAFVVRTGELEVIEGWDEERYNAKTSSPEEHAGNIAYFIPVKHGDRVLAVLGTGSNDSQRAEMIARIEAMKPLLDLTAIALSHSRVYRELRSSEERLRQAQKMEAVGQLAAGLAHNFNNMLQALMGNLELSILESGESIRKRLEDAISVCQRKSEMIKQLMLFSRNAEVTKKRVDPAMVIANAMEICEQTFDKSIDIRSEIASEIPDILGDPSQLEQVLLNLCINAQDALVDAKSEDGARQIDVSIDLVERPEPIARASKSRRFVRICVQDNGVGMDEFTRLRIFEPFFTTKKVGQGTGLGLAMAYGIVKEHDGWIDCNSEPGSGSVFSVYLPALEGARSRVVPVVAEETPRGTETVLLIEDEPDVLRLTETVLSRYGYTVLSARDGKEGLDQFRREQERIDLILLDLSMPRMSGQEFLNVIRAESPCPRIIVSTGHLHDHGNGKTPDALLKKPYRLPELLQTVRRVLDKP